MIELEAWLWAYHQVAVADLESVHGFHTNHRAFNIFKLAISEFLRISISVDCAFPGFDGSSSLEKSLDEIVFNVAGDLSDIQLLIHLRYFLL